MPKVLHESPCEITASLWNHCVSVEIDEAAWRPQSSRAMGAGSRRCCCWCLVAGWEGGWVGEMVHGRRRWLVDSAPRSPT